MDDQRRVKSGTAPAPKATRPGEDLAACRAQAADMRVEDFVRAGGLRGFTPKELFRVTAPVLDKLAYSIPNFAQAVDLSVEKVRQHIERGELVPSYVDSKPLIMREEGERWLRSRPAERRSA